MRWDALPTAKQIAVIKKCCIAGGMPVPDFLKMSRWDCCEWLRYNLPKFDHLINPIGPSCYQERLIRSLEDKLGRKAPEVLTVRTASLWIAEAKRECENRFGSNWKESKCSSG